MCLRFVFLFKILFIATDTRPLSWLHPKPGLTVASALSVMPLHCSTPHTTRSHHHHDHHHGTAGPTLLEHEAGEDKRHAICGETGDAIRKDRRSVACYPKPDETREWLKDGILRPLGNPENLKPIFLENL